MRKTILMLALATSLAGCAGFPNGGGDVPNAIDNVITQVQIVTRSVCKFVPTAETVANIIATLTGTGPIVGLVSSVADQICAAVTAKAARPGARASVHGVPVRGRFVR